jgi:biotin synthase
MDQKGIAGYPGWRGMQTAERNIEKKTGSRGLTEKEALELMSGPRQDLDDLISRACRVREEFHGKSVRMCAIINAKSGQCPERCAFCSQSKYFHTASPVYPLKSPEEILDAAGRAEKDLASEFSIVTSGRSVRSKSEIASIARSIRLIKGSTGLGRCASLGELHPEVYFMLKEAGLQCYHHNVETAPSLHPRIVPTHTFEDEARIISHARAADLVTCCGGILGMGETDAQRVELIFALRDIDPDRIPLNFLDPIRGTPLEGMNQLGPEDCLRIIAVFRLAMPEKHMIICGGRERNLGSLQKKIFDAGATGTMVGDYLTTEGQSPGLDREMIQRAGYRIAGTRK